MPQFNLSDEEAERINKLRAQRKWSMDDVDNVENLSPEERADLDRHIRQVASDAQRGKY